MGETAKLANLFKQETFPRNLRHGHRHNAEAGTWKGSMLQLPFVLVSHGPRATPLRGVAKTPILSPQSFRTPGPKVWDCHKSLLPWLYLSGCSKESWGILRRSPTRFQQWTRGNNGHLPQQQKKQLRNFYQKLLVNTEYKKQTVYTPEVSNSPWKVKVGRLLPFWDGKFSGAVWKNFQGVCFWWQHVPSTKFFHLCMQDKEGHTSCKDLSVHLVISRYQGTGRLLHHKGPSTIFPMIQKIPQLLL